MINSIAFKDFRGLDDVTLSLSQVTMLTGTNGVGKTSVLEGLYCLFSETRLDVSPLSRYNKSIGIMINQAANVPVGFAARQNYNYRLFWDECPSYEQAECSVSAKTNNGLAWSWKYRKAKLSDLSSQITMNNPVSVDSSTEFALWNWQTTGRVNDKKSHQFLNVNEKFSRAQILAQDGGLYLLPLEGRAMSICKYLDFASIRLQPQKLSFNTSKQLTEALKIINPRVTDVRLTDIESGLSVVLDDSNSVTLGTIGNGAVTWASALIAIFDVIESIKNEPQMDTPVLLLIDEMGAGIHYSIMLDVWKYINAFAKQNPKVQFVFTSHSDDCIRAYCKAFSDSDVARIVRLHQSAVDHKVIPTDYLKSQFSKIAEGDWEVRG
ncbi:MAG: AAA family ATPase [Clostridiales Family XIII bacterium]|nr:AAA family ATPase [Clostridiales Family XIII bacterium]